MRVDLSMDGDRVELGFDCDSEEAADALFTRLRTMLAEGAINFRLSGPDGAPPAIMRDAS